MSSTSRSSSPTRSARKRLLSPRFAPRQQVVVEKHLDGIDTPGLAATEQAAAADARTSDRAEIRTYQSERVAIEARCTTPCLLVLTDLDYPGWEVRVNGEFEDIVRVNTLFRGLLLGPGLHQVKYLYRPHSFRIGAAITLSTLALLLLAGGYGIARGHRRHQSLG